MGETLTKHPAAHPIGRLLMVTATVVSFVLAGLVVGTAAVSAAPAAAVTSTSCGTVTWGSMPKTSPSSSNRPIIDVRAGRHPCFDRLVIDLGPGGPTVGYDVRYVSQVVSQGRGSPVPVGGGAMIQIVVRAPAYPAGGSPAFHPQDVRQVVAVSGFTTFRQVAYAGSFEGRTSFALGVRARLPMRAFVVAGPGSGQRLVIDIAHRW